MSEGADSSTHSCENSLTTLRDEGKPNVPPPATTTYIGRRPRFGTGNAPASPYIWIDGRQLRSALAYTKKWPPRRVSFPTNDTHLVTGYLEPANPWKHAENVDRMDLISAYKESCIRHSTEPLEKVIGQLENLVICKERCSEFNLKGVTLAQNNSEALEEILKRVQFNKIDLEATSLNEESSVILFDMLEYYESAKHLNISCNPEIGVRGWQACSHMIKKTPCLEQLEAKDVMLTEQYTNILSRALRLVYHLHVLKLENCGLSGRPIVILVTALKMNTGIRELYLADNGLDLYDAIQLGSLLRINNRLQLLDISNNNIQDDGVRDILLGLINQINEDKDGKGLSILILWNNRLTQKSSPYFSQIIASSRSLETLNIGKNMLTDELLITVKDSLEKNPILLQLGMQSTELTCEGIMALADVIEKNQVLQRIDLRNNNIQMRGLTTLCAAMKKNKSVTQLDLDDKPRVKIDGTLHQYMDLVAEIRDYSRRNETDRQLGENAGNSESPRHHSRLCSASSRKISLTCQTLPCTPSPPVTSSMSDESGRSTLEPTKRTSGGRLRSPAPSPIPSPVASPIPSSSRSRFVVSRVSEASLRSTDSSASSSPITPPSFGSVSPCFFPSATSGASRFRVSVVEPASSVPSPKSVVTSSKSNVTIGFNFKVDSAESIDDSEDPNDLSKAGSPQTTPSKRNTDNVNTTSNSRFNLIPITVSSNTESNVTSSSDCSTNTSEISTNKDFSDDSQNTRKKIIDSQDNTNVDIVDDEKDVEVNDDQGKSAIESKKSDGSVLSAKAKCSHDNVSENVEDTQTNVKTNENNRAIKETVDIADANKEAESVAKQSAGTFLNQKTEHEHQLKNVNVNSPAQKHTSSLDKLLALFQHPSSLFSDSSNANQGGDQVKNPLQDSVSSMMAFGDKFQQYLREGKGLSKPNTADTYALSSDFAPLRIKNKSLKSLNVTQLPSIQTLTNMFASFKLESSANASELHTKSGTDQKNNTDQSFEMENDDNKKKKKKKKKEVAEKKSPQCNKEVCNYENRNIPGGSSREEETSVSTLNIQTLPENVQSKNDGHTNKDLVLETNCVASNAMVVETCSKAVHNNSLINVPESKTTACIPKLKDIPEYSILEISKSNTTGNDNDRGYDESVEDRDSLMVEKVCDRSSTDSINLTSDNNSSSCNIVCDIKVIDNVNTTTSMLCNIPESISSHKNSSNDGVVDDGLLFILDAHDKRSETASVTTRVERRNDNVNNISNVSHHHHHLLEGRVEKESNLNDQVTNTRIVAAADRNNKESCSTASHESSIRVEGAEDTCHVDDSPRLKSTTVNSKVNHLSISELSFILKEDVINDIRRNDAQLEFSESCANKLTILPKEEILSDLITEDKPSLTPNNIDVHRTTFKDAKIDHCCLENSISKSTYKESACTTTTTIPTVILPQATPDISVSVTTEYLEDFEKDTDTEDLIFCITDISTDGIPPSKETLSPGAIPNATWENSISSKVDNSFFDLPQTSHSSTTLFIEKSENLHRNSQDSGIAEVNLSTSDDNIPETTHSQPKESFQESIDSGIESECSSVCIKATSEIGNSKDGILILKETLDDIDDDRSYGRITDLTDFVESDVVEHIHQTNTTDTYLELVKCAVVTSACTMGGMDLTDRTSIGITSEENNTVVAESSAMVQTTSPK